MDNLPKPTFSQALDSAEESKKGIMVDLCREVFACKQTIDQLIARKKQLTAQILEIAQEANITQVNTPVFTCKVQTEERFTVIDPQALQADPLISPTLVPKVSLTAHSKRLLPQKPDLLAQAITVETVAKLVFKDLRSNSNTTKQIGY